MPIPANKSSQHLNLPREPDFAAPHGQCAASPSRPEHERRGKQSHECQWQVVRPRSWSHTA